MPKKKVRWYFSLRSPYSWFAYRELRAEYPWLLDRMEWLPYWEPDARTSELLAERGIQLALTEMPRAKNLYILQDAKRTARARGLEIAWPVDRNPCWELPHLGYLAAQEAGSGVEFVDAAYRARWEQGRDICSAEVLAEIAGELGLDPAAIAGAAQEDRLRERGVELLAAGERDGVFGVPFFLYGREKFWGVERLGAFAAMVAADTATEPEVVPAPAGQELALDGGHAGGCG
ncbi:2-hydroxychromene-2-carboxylate isomerase [Sciscionella marina]|uniref:2-hydroxychromene-2-carboxylate isomerase n=1 Tax=Sciscionella marina TaxID=508770 RepID=UPI00037387F6|nr:DsbA family protein [Sciscionella marina]